MREQCFDLSGVWRFAMCPVSSDKVPYEPADSVWPEYFDDEIHLPSTTALSKKGPENYGKEAGFLTERYPFSGYAFFQRTLTISLEKEKRYILELERTRLTRVWFGQTELQGCREADSLVMPHRYDLTDALRKENGTGTLTIRVANVGYPTKGGHMTSPDTQTNWCGILGKIVIKKLPSVCVREAVILTDVEKSRAQIRLTLFHNGTCPVPVRIDFEMQERTLAHDQKKKLRFPGVWTNKVPPGETEASFCVTVPEAKLWSEYTPVCYTGRFFLNEEEAFATQFGFRAFAAKDGFFTINGYPVFLRGKHDGMLFPLTGAAPMDTEAWVRVFQTAKEYGINHYRFHTCIPPEAAFDAADLTGIYLSPELPFWGTLSDKENEGCSKEELSYLCKEGERTLSEFGNHPSFVMLSLGNELWGSDDLMNRLIGHYKALRSDKLYTQGSNNFQWMPRVIPNDDYFVGVRFDRKRLLRGSYAMCDAPQGFVQTAEPTMAYDYEAAFSALEDPAQEDFKDEKIKIQYGTTMREIEAKGSRAADSGFLLPPRVPVLSHEIGQYAVYPNLSDIEKYTGVLRAGNLSLYAERLKDAGLLSEAASFTACSGALAVSCYKSELEAAMRTPSLAGFQLLDLQDFPGQNGAYVGILDAFLDSKGLISAKDWRGFCSDTVPMARFDRYVLTEQTKFCAELWLRYQNFMRPLFKERLCVVLSDETNQRILFEESFAVPDHAYGLCRIGDVKIPLPAAEHPALLRLSLRISGAENHYRLTLYPKNQAFSTEKAVTSEFAKAGIRIAESKEELQRLSVNGARVLYLPKKQGTGVPGTYCTDFWCYPMFRAISEEMKKPLPVGTMGLQIEKSHPALAGLCTEHYTTPDWYQLISHSELTILDGTAVRPIVRMIDNFERNWNLGLLYEKAFRGARVLCCHSPLLALTDYAEVRSLLFGLRDYMAGDHFCSWCSGRSSENSLPKDCFPVLDRNLSTEGADVGASVTEAGEFLAKVGSEMSEHRVFG